MSNEEWDGVRRSIRAQVEVFCRNGLSEKLRVSDQLKHSDEPGH